MNPSTTTPVVLIVDDELTNRLILRSLVKKLGYNCIEAENGEKAVEEFRRNQPDLVFMDIMMPVMNGYDATRIIKQESKNRFVAVIFLTAMTDEESLQACINAGGDDFMIKPYDQFILRSKIQAMQRITNLNREIQGMYSLIHREQEIAEQVFNNAVQKTNIDNDAIKAVLRPASTFSGDMILSEYSPSRDIHVLLGDFTGHGLSSALGAMPVSEVFRAMTAKGFDVDEVLLGINKKLKQFLPVGMFLGTLMVSISHNLEQVTVYNCGMPDLLIVDGASGQIKQHVKSNSLPLGVIDRPDISESGQTFALTPGDKLVLYSDGLTEAWSEDEEEFGSQRLQQAIVENRQGELSDSIMQALDDFCGERTQSDDVTLIEVDCVNSLLPQVEHHDSPPAANHHFDSRGDWEFVFALHGKRLQETNPVPIIINQVMEMEGVESERQSLFAVLTELYVNALDHGVLQLDSKLKSDPAGFAEYFSEREKRLNNLEDGSVTFHISVEQNNKTRSMLLHIEDSGHGFDFENKPVINNEQNTGLSGRGIVLIRELCESLNYLGKGNIAEAVYSWKSLS